MHVVMLNYYYEAGLATGASLLERFYALPGWAEGLRGAGMTITVLQRFWRDEVLERNGVLYRFVSDSKAPHLRKWQIPSRLHHLAVVACKQSLAEGQPAAVHLNGLIFPLQARHLRAVLPRSCAIVAQHHAESPAQGLRRLVQRWGLAAVDGFMFTALELSRPWQVDALTRREQDIFPVMEGSTDFSPQDRGTARQRTGMVGNPVFLWVGRLIGIKDPLTVLSGFESALKALPSARLYMIYQDSHLLSQVQAVIAGSEALRQAVTLLGSVPHDQMDACFNSADYFLLGSHHEGSGFALAEALACGVVPIVTDIPSFRMMTDQGRLGELWPVGQAGACAAAILKAANRPLDEESLAVRRFFDAHLSYPAIGRQARAIYETLARRLEMVS